jgi:hypothetical protein
MAQPNVLQDLARVVQHKRITTGGKKPDWAR